MTPSGKATTSTSQGAFRSTYSTVGEKNRDCRRQRGAEPTTIRSLPRRLASPTIALPIERARIVSVCDAYGAMTKTRPYRAALMHDAALVELERHSGTQFDPDAVEALIEFVRMPERLSA